VHNALESYTLLEGNLKQPDTFRAFSEFYIDSIGTCNIQKIRSISTQDSHNRRIETCFLYSSALTT
jgi:hypothetical protein